MRYLLADASRLSRLWQIVSQARESLPAQSVRWTVRSLAGSGWGATSETAVRTLTESTQNSCPTFAECYRALSAQVVGS